MSDIPIAKIPFDKDLFSSLRSAYPNFADWIKHIHASSDRRLAFIVGNRDEPAGIAILKLGESPRGDNPTWMKISTLKVSAEHEDAGVGDALLSAVLRTAVAKGMPHLFITMMPDQVRLLEYLRRRGFRHDRQTTSLGEAVLVLDITDPNDVFVAVNTLTYDTLALAYQARSLRPTPDQENPAMLASALIDALPHPPEARILELGPGGGDVLAYLAERCRLTVGLEVSPRMARIAAERAPNAVICICDATTVDFPKASFDGIYAGAFIHLIPLGVATHLMHRIAYWLSPGGALFVNTSIRADLTDLTFEAKSDYPSGPLRIRSSWTEAALRDLIEGAGLTVERRLFTDEQTRGKQWVAFVARKSTEEGKS